MGIHIKENGFLISSDMYEKDTANDILVRFQAGISKDEVRNGIDIEELIELAVIRIGTYQSIEPCPENMLAVRKLQEAQHWLEHRKKDREKRAVLGTNQK